jgi:hypothetical protein
MAHQRHAHFLHYSCFHEPRVVSVAEIMKSVMPEPCVFERTGPGRLDGVTDWLVLIGED